MDKTICGHERNELLCVLRWAVGDDKRDRTKVRCECGGPCCVIYNDLIDPAKLAEMLATEGRRLGFNVCSDKTHDDVRPYVDMFAIDGRVSIAASIMWQECFFGDIAKEHELPQARAILLQWLQLPDGAREEAEKALRGEP